MEKVRILGISASPRHANTEIGVKEALAGAAELPGVETEFYTIIGKKLNPCLSTCRCMREGTEDNPCPDWGPKDDLVLLSKKMTEFDGFIFGSPVYTGGVSAQMKILWDRVGMIGNAPQMTCTLRNKVAGVVAAGALRNCGVETTQLDIWRMCVFLDMIPVGTGPEYVDKVSSWGGGLTRYLNHDNQGEYEESWFGTPAEKYRAREDVDGMQSCRNVGRRVAEIAKVIKAGFKAVPKEETYWPSGAITEKGI